MSIAIISITFFVNTYAIELIENYYKGEKYVPSGAYGYPYTDGDGRRFPYSGLSKSEIEKYPYSSDFIAGASNKQGGGPVRKEDIKAIVPTARKVNGNSVPPLTFSSLMDHLGQALRSQVRGHGSGGQPRNLDTDSDKENTAELKETGKDDLHYHFYPHNQHLFQLPECATQQVCNAVYRRLNFTQPLCQCPSGSDPCSASLLTNDQRSIELSMGGPQTRATTVIKTCEPVWSVRECRTPRDWSILALQNTRTGKAHYLVICKCPRTSKLEGPLNHDQPSYAQVPGIRVYGMMCIGRNYRRVSRETAEDNPAFPWHHLKEALKDGADILRDLEESQGPHIPLLTLQ